MDEMEARVWRLAARGFLAFGLGRGVYALAEWAVFAARLSPYSIPSCLLAASFAGGFVGALAFLWQRPSPAASIRAAAGFGVGFLVASAILFLTVDDPRVGTPHLLRDIPGYAAAFAVAGAVGAAFFKPRLIVAAAACFGAPAAVTSVFTYLVWAQQSPSAEAATTGLSFIPYCVGGALFGAALGAGGLANLVRLWLSEKGGEE